MCSHPHHQRFQVRPFYLQLAKRFPHLVLPPHVASLSETTNMGVEQKKAFHHFINTVDTEECTALHRAVLASNVRAAEVLANHGADLDARKRNLQTPAHLAAFTGEAQVLMLLISKGARTNATDELRRTPLHMWVECHVMSRQLRVRDTVSTLLTTAPYYPFTPMIKVQISYRGFS